MPPTWFCSPYSAGRPRAVSPTGLERDKDKQKESAFLRAGEVEVKREREKERKRTRDKEKERRREREKASRCTKRISAAKTGREVARARWKVAGLDPRSSKSLAVDPKASRGYGFKISPGPLYARS
jgi:hypothetical protein